MKAQTTVDDPQVRRFAESLQRFDFVFDKFEDPLQFPGTEGEASLAANFFFFLVAIDHRTHSPGRTFRGIVRGVELTGAELMWALARKRLDEDPCFFSPERLSTVSGHEIAKVFSVHEPDEVQIAGPEERARLLQDSASVLMRDFEGSILNTVATSQGQLVRSDEAGFLQLLQRFEAYADPVKKKSFLLVKFLERRRFLTVRDPENLHVPVDNILQRIALRSGMVTLNDPELEQRLRSGLPVAKSEERTLREATMKAFDSVCAVLGLSATYLDDILWEFGRVHCLLQVPICDRLPETVGRRAYRMIREGPVGECPFGVGCRGYRNPDRWELREPSVQTIYY